ncbi:hypothetical protein PT974_06659 [Cladobotryum mycophilum]|uniref:Uncharacterized protein n=1 Tax=Cladobotryum mycophilum TaxID=491253 RepID=A0ABR0SN87_9HYPO
MSTRRQRGGWRRDFTMPLHSETSSPRIHTPDEDEKSNLSINSKREDSEKKPTSSIIGYKVELDGPPMTVQRLTMECIRLDQERIRMENAMARQREEIVFLQERIRALEAREVAPAEEVRDLRSSHEATSERLDAMERRRDDAPKNLSFQQVIEVVMAFKLFEDKAKTEAEIARVKTEIEDIRDTLRRVTSHVFPNEDNDDDGDNYDDYCRTESPQRDDWSLYS